MNRDEQYKEVLRGRLTERRFIHSLNVADSAKQLAEIYGCNAEEAYTAGLVHDCNKDTPAGLQLSYMLENGMELTRLEADTAKLYHAMSGSIFIRKELGIDNTDIINSVRYHTTGRAGMTLLEKIVFIADFISKDRDYDGVEVMREKALKSLDAAIAEGLGFTIKELVENSKAVHPDTVDAYNEAVMNINKEVKK